MHNSPAGLCQSTDGCSRIVEIYLPGQSNMTPLAPDEIVLIPHCIGIRLQLSRGSQARGKRLALKNNGSLEGDSLRLIEGGDHKD
jgi:hypothetical protein